MALSGSLTAVRAMQFRQDLILMLQERQVNCTIDISDLVALDLAGVNALALAHSTTQSYGKALTIVSNADNPADEFLHLTKLNKVIDFKRS